ncbi:MAG: transcription antitermination factor NusB [Candidatus Omnitrophica bacterium]|nr:transcription antitermination factor NusB [Candidatus Omnitrophota bacterium]
MSSLRTQARRLAVQILFALEEGGGREQPLKDLLTAAAPKAPKEVVAYATEIVGGVEAQQSALDQRLEGASEHWSLERIHPIEKCILRLGLYELTYKPDIPARVALNEAIDLAKRFGDDEAWRFVNGVLDKLGAARIQAEQEQ